MEAIKVTMHCAPQLQKQDKNIAIRVYLMSDAVFCALDGQTVKQGNYNIGSMLTDILNVGGEVRICTSCAEFKGLKDPLQGATLGTLSDLTTWIVESEKVLSF